MISIIYGSTKGNCKAIAEQIAAHLPGSTLINAADLKAENLAESSSILLGSSTWGKGELQKDWVSAIEILKAADLKGKTVAIFGCGDSNRHGDTYCNAMGTLFHAAETAGAKVVGSVSTEGYTYETSQAVVGDHFVGLALDQVNHADLTEGRIAAWVEQIKGDLS